MGYACEVIRDSVAPHGARLTTMVVTFPRIVLAEMNTHRAFSRNAASSRAIPVKKMIERVEEDPFVPDEWGANKKGMQAGEPLDVSEAEKAAAAWSDAREDAIWHARRIAAIGVHKQIVNRLLEPWMWTTVVVSSTGWGNFFRQRCSPLAQPEIRTVAEMMRDALADSTPELVEPGKWHLPFVTFRDRGEAIERFPLDVEARTPYLIKLAVARSARVSYLNHNGVRSPEDDLALFEKLRTADPPHLSPFEHVATPAPTPWTRSGNFEGWGQLRHLLGEMELAA